MPQKQNQPHQNRRRSFSLLERLGHHLKPSMALGEAFSASEPTKITRHRPLLNKLPAAKPGSSPASIVNFERVMAGTRSLAR